MGLKGLISNYLKSKNESFFKTIPIYKILVANKQNENDGLRLFREMNGFVLFFQQTPQLRKLHLFC